MTYDKYDMHLPEALTISRVSPVVRLSYQACHVCLLWWGGLTYQGRDSEVRRITVSDFIFVKL